MPFELWTAALNSLKVSRSNPCYFAVGSGCPIVFTGENEQKGVESISFKVANLAVEAMGSNGL